MVKVAVSYTNFGPYHLARLRAFARQLNQGGGSLVAYEMAGTHGIYPWKTCRTAEPFEWVTLFSDRVLEDLSSASCHRAIKAALDRDRPDAVGAVGYSRPESMALLNWARANGRPAVLLSESQEIDNPRVWWKEAVKRRRVSRFDAGLVGGPRHRDYLVSLGMPRDRISLGNNAVDGDAFAALADWFRHDPHGRRGVPDAPYFLAVSRFAPEKNLPRLVRAFARYRKRALLAGTAPWDLALCGDGPAAPSVSRAIAEGGVADSVHRPGFLQSDALARWYAFASAFVLPSLQEPWGLVVNEAASCGLPLLVSERAGCVETFVPDGPDSTGLRINPDEVDGMAAAIHWMAHLGANDRRAMGDRAAAIAREWGPGRFARGVVEAFQTAFAVRKLRECASAAASVG